MYRQASTGKRPAGARRRKGAVIVLAAVAMVVFVCVLGFSVDIGYLEMARSQAQHCADAAALAAALEMTTNENLKKSDADRIAAATVKAEECAALQDINTTVGADSPEGATSVVESVKFGRLQNPDNPNEVIQYVDPANPSVTPNVVEVSVSCSPARGTAVPLFFARIFGVNEGETFVKKAVATFSTEETSGFDKEDETPCTLMPFVVKEQDWNNFLSNGGEDNFSYDPDTKTVSPGPDGIPEIKMYPETELGSPGNFGTVNIGRSSDNSASRLRDQIRNGPSADDMSVYDGILRLDPVTKLLELTGAATLQVEADPGMTASIKNALADVVGHPKTIMLYNQVQGSGDNARFTISRFVGVRIVDFHMTGAARNKYVLIQPAIVQDTAVVTDDDSQTSDFVGQPVHLVR